jgi:hypothetical protein
MKFSVFLALLATGGAASAEAIGPSHRHPTRLDLGSVCLSPLFGSDAAHSSGCTTEGQLARYRPSKPIRKSKAWDQIGPCYRATDGKDGGDDDKTAAAATEYCVYYNGGFAHGRGVTILTHAKRARYLAKLLGLVAAASSDLTGSVGIGANKNKTAVGGAGSVVEEGTAAGTAKKLWDYDVNRFTHKARVVPIPGKEFGVVATETIFKGEAIISETSSVMIDYGAEADVPEMDLLRMQAVGLEYLPEAHRARVLQMSTHGQMLDHVHKIEKIFVTNAFDVHYNDEDENKLYSVFAETARMNHDCRPNVDYYFDAKTLTQHASAIRDIYPGEELTLSYIKYVAAPSRSCSRPNGPRTDHSHSPLRTRESRLGRLHRQWGFRCSCALCTSAPALGDSSDARIRQIEDLRGELGDWGASSRATPQMAELLVSLLEQERVWGLLGEAHAYAAVEHNGAGDAWTALRYAHLAVEEGLTLMRGKEDSDVRDMKSLIEDPWGHWSWMAREKKRMGWGKKPADDEEEDDDE